MAITMEIIEHHDIHAEIPNGGYPRRLAIEASCIGQLFCERGVEMRCHHLISRDRSKAISMRVSQDSCARGGGIGVVEIEISRHALPCAWRSVIQSVNPFDPDGLIAAGVVALSYPH